jgi:hypothetical protein
LSVLAPVEAATAAMRNPVPLEVVHSVYGTENSDGSRVYIVRAPLPAGSQPCLDRRCSLTNCTSEALPLARV